MGALAGEEARTSGTGFRIVNERTGTVIASWTEAGSQSFGSGLALTGPLNTVFLTTVNVTNQGQASFYSIPDAGANADFVMTAGTQTIGGQKTISTGLTISNGVNIAVGAGTGTKIGTLNTQKIGFYNVTPAIQPISSAGFTNASGGATNGDLVVIVNNVVAALRTLGLVALA